MQRTGKYKIRPGQRFGRGEVLSKSDRKKHWILQCDCGNTYEVSTSNLGSGQQRSCGCIKRDLARKVYAKRICRANTLPDGDGGLNALFATYRRTARIRSLEFSLTIQEFRHLTSGNCRYCGKEPSQKRGNTKSNGKLRPACIYTYNGIDRADSSQGYTLDNSVSCCKTCNLMKLTASPQEFIVACSRVTEHQNRKRLAEMTSQNIGISPLFLTI